MEPTNTMEYKDEHTTNGPMGVCIQFVQEAWMMHDMNTLHITEDKHNILKLTCSTFKVCFQFESVLEYVMLELFYKKIYNTRIHSVIL